MESESIPKQSKRRKRRDKPKQFDQSIIKISDQRETMENESSTDKNQAAITEDDRMKILEKFKHSIGLVSGGNAQKPKNIIVLGVAGVGKSSFLNTILTSLSDTRCWIERADVGMFNDGHQTTLHISKHDKQKYLTDAKEFMYAYPTLFDMVGLENENSLLIQEMLRVIIFGRRGKGETPYDIKEFVRNHLYDTNTDAVRERYFKNPERDRIDRIIFVASAKKNSPLPTKLISAVLKSTHNNKLKIPVYGVLTHCDLVDMDDSEFLDKEKEFRLALGLPENKYLRCQNYCDEYDKKNNVNRLDTAIPKIEIPVIKFMTQVCNPHLVAPETEPQYHVPKTDAILAAIKDVSSRYHLVHILALVICLYIYFSLAITNMYAIIFLVFTLVIVAYFLFFQNAPSDYISFDP